jgi:hypothetical protein
MDNADCEVLTNEFGMLDDFLAAPSASQPQVMAADSGLRLCDPANRGLTRAQVVLRECRRHLSLLSADAQTEADDDDEFLVNRKQLQHRNNAIIEDTYRAIVDVVLPTSESSLVTQDDLRQYIKQMKRASQCSTGNDLIAGLKRATHAGERPPFSDDDARVHYVHEYAPQRCLTFSVALYDRICNRVFSSLLIDHDQQSPVYALSIGGGPGFDFIALLLLGVHLLELHKYVGTRCDTDSVRTLDLRVIDNEAGWQSQVEFMANKCLTYVRPAPSPLWTQSRCVFEWGDITCADVDSITLNRTDLFVFQYVILENAMLLRGCDWGMVRTVLRHAKKGAIVYVVDSSDALFPEVCSIAAAENANRSTTMGAWQCHVPKVAKKQKTPNALMLVSV